MSENLVVIKGQIERITFNNKENGFTIAKIKTEDSKILVTVAGILPFAAVGINVEIEGNWKKHPKFGNQIEIKSARQLAPETIAGILKYLSSGIIKGIGPSTATKIVKFFGKDTLKILESDIEELSKIQGIGTLKLEKIKKSWEEHNKMRSIQLFLASIGVKIGIAAKLFAVYGENTISILRENPYSIVFDVQGIGFMTADTIARNVGYELNGIERAKAGILYCLENESLQNGHTFLKFNELLKISSEILNIHQSICKNAIFSLYENNQKIIILNEDDEILRIQDLLNENFSADFSKIFLAQTFSAEDQIAKTIYSLNKMRGKINEISFAKIAESERELKIQLSKKQREAVEESFSNKILVITGGPGTGKTTIIKTIINIFSKYTKKILLAAPTGRAAKRMNETTGWKAQTIHKLLKCYQLESNVVTKASFEKLDTDLIIIDEASMIDIFLMKRLLQVIPHHANLIIVGDINQLPSIGPGNVLRDIIDSEFVKVVRLNEIFRQAKVSKIVESATDIIHGIIPKFQNQKNDDIFFIETQSSEETFENITSLIESRIKKNFGYDPKSEIQVLSPMHKGILGTINLNLTLQKIINHKNANSQKFKQFLIGDKVMQIKNNYEKDIYNGDIGYITDFDQENQNLYVDFDDRSVEFDFENSDELILAYATSIHKSQGSEYPCVIIPLATEHYCLLQRNLLYTAITRGKNLVILIGTKKALNIAVKTEKTIQRNSALKIFLQQLFKN